MKKAILPSLLITLSFHVFAQTNYTAGYIIKSNGDTLRGFLQEETRKGLLLKVKFRNDIDKSGVQEFSPADVMAFQYKGGNLYRSIAFSHTSGDTAADETCFARQLVKGKYNLYEFEKDGNLYFVVLDGSSSYLMNNTEYAGTGAIKEEGNYETQLDLLKSPCRKNLFNSSSIAYNEKDIHDVIVNINNCISPAEASESYYHADKTRSEVLVYAGFLPLGDQSQVTAEAIFRVKYPQIGKKVSLNIGLRYARKVDEYVNTIPYIRIKNIRTTHQIYDVPLTIQYNLFTGRIRPFIYIGFSVLYLKESDNSGQTNYKGLQQNFGFAGIGGAGLEINIIKGLMARADWRYESFVQFPSVGIAYRFADNK